VNGYVEAEFPACVSTIDLPDVLCGCETLPLVLGEGHKIDDVKEQMAEEDLSVCYSLRKKRMTFLILLGWSRRIDV
jgi:hypothetical protein